MSDPKHWGDDVITAPGGPFKLAEPVRYECPTHGSLWRGGNGGLSFGACDVIISTIPGHEGVWCQRCWLEALDRIGVNRAKPEEPR